MKKFDLNGFGVQEMDAKGMEEANGGIIPLLILGAFAWGIYNGYKEAEANAHV